jgi:hypothetical protein
LEKKYGHLVKKLNIQKGPGGALPNQLIWLDSKTLEGVPLNFGGGDHTTTGYWHTWAGAHTHSCDEVLFFLGLDPSDITYLGAEVAMEMGEEQEEHVIKESSIVVVPKGLPHGPFTTLQVDKPFRGCHILLASEYQANWLPKETKPPKTAGNKYSRLIKPLKGKVISPAKMGVGSGNADQLVWFFSKDLEGLEINFTWGIYSGCGIWHREKGKSIGHIHPYDEILVFVGLDPNNLNYLGAEIEIDMGAEHERHIFSEPTVVICPKGFQHTPLITRWVDKPFGCFVICLNPEYTANWVE